MKQLKTLIWTHTQKNNINTLNGVWLDPRELSENVPPITSWKPEKEIFMKIFSLC